MVHSRLDRRYYDYHDDEGVDDSDASSTYQSPPFSTNTSRSSSAQASPTSVHGFRDLELHVAQPGARAATRNPASRRNTVVASLAGHSPSVGHHGSSAPAFTLNLPFRPGPSTDLPRGGSISVVSQRLGSSSTRIPTGSSRHQQRHGVSSVIVQSRAPLSTVRRPLRSGSWPLSIRRDGVHNNTSRSTAMSTTQRSPRTQRPMRLGRRSQTSSSNLDRRRSRPVLGELDGSFLINFNILSNAQYLA